MRDDTGVYQYKSYGYYMLASGHNWKPKPLELFKGKDSSSLHKFMKVRKINLYLNPWKEIELI